jgi:hypothetical protein
VLLLGAVPTARPSLISRRRRDTMDGVFRAAAAAGVAGVGVATMAAVAAAVGLRGCAVPGTVAHSELSVGALRRKAIAAGVELVDVEIALEHDDPKTQLAKLLLEHSVPDTDTLPASMRGPAQEHEPGPAAELRAELQALKLLALRKRALSAGAKKVVVEGAMDEDNPKAALAELVVQLELRRGPSERILSCLHGGGETCAAMVREVLDHAMDVLETRLTSSPRKARKALLETIERLEAVLESIDSVWCDSVSRCGRDELDRLSDLIVCVRGLSSSSVAVSEASDAVSAMIECLDRCGSVVVQSMGVLCAAEGADCSKSVLRALESLRGLSEAGLERVCADEAAAFEVVKGRLSALDACF